MVDVAEMPADSFGYVPTPAIVAPIEFYMSRTDFEDMGGYLDAIVDLETVLKSREITHQSTATGKDDR